MRIGSLAQEAGVTPDTIRYYERIGLLAPPERGRNRYRHYDHSTLDDLHFIRKAQTLGLTLHDIMGILEIARGGRPPCQHVRSLVADRLGEVEQKLADLRAMRTTLRGILDRLERVPSSTRGCRCAAIETA